MRIHPDAPSVAEIDLYQSSTRSCRRTNSAINRRQKLRSFFSRGCYGGDLHRRKRWCNLFRCPCLATPGKHQAGRYSVAPRNLSYLRARCQRLLDNPCLVVLRPTPPPLEPAQNLDPHRLITLKLDLRSHASRITTRHARRSSSEAYGALKTPHKQSKGPRRYAYAMASTTAGTNGGSSATGAGCRRACRRQVNTCCGVSPCRRAISETTAPGTSVSSAIRALSSLENQRRRPVSVITSSRRAVTSDDIGMLLVE